MPNSLHNISFFLAEYLPEPSHIHLEFDIFCAAVWQLSCTAVWHLSCHLLSLTLKVLVSTSVWVWWPPGVSADSDPETDQRWWLERLGQWWSDWLIGAVAMIGASSQHFHSHLFCSCCRWLNSSPGMDVITHYLAMYFNIYMFSSIERFLLILLMVYYYFFNYLLIIALVSLFSVGKCWSLFSDLGGIKCWSQRIGHCFLVNKCLPL